MRKHFFNFVVFTLAIILSAFTTPKKTIETFFLILRPKCLNSTVTTNSNWTTQGGLTAYGVCDLNPDDLACSIEADEQYYHLVDQGEDVYYVLNDEAYAIQNNAEFLTITATNGINIISGPAELQGQYKIIDHIIPSDNLNDFSFNNARFMVPEFETYRIAQK